jgi:hypothetical protein
MIRIPGKSKFQHSIYFFSLLIDCRGGSQFQKILAIIAIFYWSMTNYSCIASHYSSIWCNDYLDNFDTIRRKGKCLERCLHSHSDVLDTGLLDRERHTDQQNSQPQSPLFDGLTYITPRYGSAKVPRMSSVRLPMMCRPELPVCKPSLTVMPA